MNGNRRQSYMNENRRGNSTKRFLWWSLFQDILMFLKKEIKALTYAQQQ